MNNKYNIKDSDIVIFHIGGGVGGYGPIDHVLKEFPENCVLFDFEAVEPDNKPPIEGLVRVISINECIGEKTGTYPFYVNKERDSSSMLLPSNKTVNDHVGTFVSNSKVFTWGQNTEIEKTIEVDTITLSDFINENNIIPDALSIDAQGLEFNIMKGCKDYLKLINNLVTEVEFYEIHKDQGLFSDQMNLLFKNDIRLMEIINIQRWHPGPVIGEGFMTVGEAIWFKCIDNFLKDLNHASIMRGIKLAAMAYSYSRYSYAYTILKELRSREANIPIICNNNGFGKLNKLMEIIDNNLDKYNNDKYFLENNVRKLLEVQR